MTHDLLRNVIHDLKADIQKIVVSDLKENTFYALIYLDVNGEAMAIDARPSDAIALALRARAPIFVEDTRHRQRQDGGLRAGEGGLRAAAEVAREPRPGRHGQVQDVESAREPSRPSQRSRACLHSFLFDRPLPRLYNVATSRDFRHHDDRRHRQSEGRRGQDHDRHQPGGGAVAARQADAPRRSRSRRPTARCRTWTCTHGHAQRVRRDRGAELRVRGRHRAVDAAEPLGRAVAHRAGEARVEAGGGARRAFPAEGSARADPRATIRTSSSTARRRWGC